jgi:hypothetical protein
VVSAGVSHAYFWRLRPGEGLWHSAMFCFSYRRSGRRHDRGGAYHHSQLREALLGEVSRDLLDHMTMPVLMSR